MTRHALSVNEPVHPALMMALADGPPGEIRGGFHLQDHGSHLVRRAPFKSANRHEALVLIMHAVGEANVFVLPTIFRSEPYKNRHAGERS